MKQTSNRAIVLLLFAVAAIANAWFRGPVFGLLPFYIFTLPFAAGLAYLLYKLKFDRWIKAVLAVAGAVAISYLVCAPPTTSRLFRECFSLDVPSEVRNLQRWNDNWARDPAYFLRFEADAATIDRLVSAGKFQELPLNEFELHQTWRHFRGAPRWWSPEELSSPRMWNQHDTYWVYLFFDPTSNIAYLQIFRT